MNNEKRFCIGIDPGKNTGLAIYDTKQKKLTEVLTTNFFAALSNIEIRFRPEIVLSVTVEKPNSTHVWHNQAKNKRAIQKTALNVGKCLGQTDLIIDWLIDHGYEVVTQHPQGKIDKEAFKKITDYEGSTSQHGRDAAMLVYGM